MTYWGYRKTAGYGDPRNKMEFEPVKAGITAIITMLLLGASEQVSKRRHADYVGCCRTFYPRDMVGDKGTPLHILPKGIL